jgi:hypothetical protein
MPDDFNPFDDDSLLPDWMKDDSDESAPDDASQAGQGLPPASEWAREPGRTQSPGSAEDDLRRDALSDLPWLDDSLSSESEPDDAGDLDDLLEEWGSDAISLDERLGGSPPAPAAPAVSDEDLDWLSGIGSTSEPAEEPAAPPPGGLPDWLSEMAPTPEPPASPEPPEPDISASWLQVDAFSAMPEFQSGDLTPPSAADALAGGADLPWPEDDDLGVLSALRAEPDEEPAAPAASGLPDWLRDAQPLDDAVSENASLPGWMEGSAEPPVEPEVPDWVQPPAGPPPDDAPVPEPSGSAELPDWVLASDTDLPAAPASPDLSFDAWEQQQIEDEHEAEKSPEERMMEEVPDWFSGLGDKSAQPAPPEAPAAGGEQEFVPGWFMGLEEQDVEEAPDWFQQIDYSGEALTKPAPEMPAAPTEPPPVPSEVPDWFKGLTPPETGDLDWSMFGAPAEPEPPAAPSLKRLSTRPDHEPPASETPLPPVEPPAIEPEIEPDVLLDIEPEAEPEAPAELEPQTDWAALFGSEPEAEPEPEAPAAQAAEVDFGALFGSEPESQLEAEPEAPAGLGLESEAPAGLGLESEADLAALFGSTPEPEPEAPAAEVDFDALFGSEPESQPDAPPEGGFAAMFGVEVEPDALEEESESAFLGTDRMATPEDIPFPDLELDQEMPTADTDEVLEEWMAEFVTPGPASIDPSGDFVERFDPGAEDASIAPLDEDAPDWLRSFEEGEEPARATSEQPAVSSLPGSDEGGLDWLSGISSEDVVPEADAGPAAQPDQGARKAEAPQDADSMDIDSLLSLYTPPPEPAPPPEPEPVEEAAQDELPPELQIEEPPDVWEIFGTPDPHALEEGVEPNFEALLDDAALPTVDDLFPLPPGHESESAAPARPLSGLEAAPPTEPPPPEPAIPDAFQPEWVSELRPTELPVTVRAGGIAVDVEQRSVIDLPDQLQVFRETALRDLKQSEPPTPAPETGPLAGIAGALAPLEVAIPRSVAPVTGLTITREQQARADRLRHMLDAAADGDVIDDDLREPEMFPGGDEEVEAEQAAPRVRSRRSSRLKLDRVLIALLLLVALIAPFATDVLHFAADPPALSGDRLAVADAVNALDAGDYVLVAMEYGPTAAGELDPLAEAVVRDVLAHRAIPLTTGTSIAGALHARAVIAPLTSDERLLAARSKNETILEPGQDYYLLGFIPGDASGVRALRGADEDHALTLPSPFTTDIDGETIDLNLNITRDVALIVVVGESSDDVRLWAEQMGGAGVPMVELVTAAIEPLAASYVNEDGYQGYLAGYRDTRSYDTAQNAETRTPYTPPDDLGFDLPDLDAGQWNSTALGAAVAAGLIALGMIVNLFRALVRRGRQ